MKSTQSTYELPPGSFYAGASSHFQQYQQSSESSNLRRSLYRRMHRGKSGAYEQPTVQATLAEQNFADSPITTSRAEVAQEPIRRLFSNRYIQSIIDPRDAI